MWAGETAGERLFLINVCCCCVQGLTSVQTNDEYAIDVYQALMEQSASTSGSGDSSNGSGSGGLPCRVFLTPVYEETLPENNLPLPAQHASSTDPEAERSSLLALGALPPPGHLGGHSVMRAGLSWGWGCWGCWCC
jgi:hypothetical protein